MWVAVRSEIILNANHQITGVRHAWTFDETAEDAKALSEAFFSQLGPNSNFGSQFAQTVMVKCSDAPS